ncbi:glucokinase [Marinagarivorans cellulosilyticus]|uniref:Glucokinase n=1 Tax=Marinagarivorans cellulosilyticus TaxID=2721545 RepID=A0AAN1WJW4_9GAMM|nr:glucokinase [Marinagarivorans cellulosilyticus]BCD98978.1 glucokinase [Marinagarivorans cellulosilyticus]
MFPYVVADIGGTNARFALVTGKDAGLYALEHIHILKGKDYASFQDALSAYLDKLDGIKPTAMCAAVAGPVVGDQVQMTNLSWGFSCAAVAEQFGFKAFVAMNDFAAVAAGIPLMGGDHLITFKDGTPQDNTNKAVFGPGTGLGVAGVIRHNGLWLPNPCEGGHINIAPTSAFEADIIKAAIGHHGHASAETFISGPGLVNLYNAICEVEGSSAAKYEPSDITTKALDGSDATCVTTLNTFCSFLGSFAGNLALTYGATGGIYLAGGILPRFSDFVIKSDFSAKFAHKGPMSSYVENIPAYLVTHNELAFNGAAAWLEQQLTQ